MQMNLDSVHLEWNRILRQIRGVRNTNVQNYRSIERKATGATGEKKVIQLQVRRAASFRNKSAFVALLLTEKERYFFSKS